MHRSLEATGIGTASQDQPSGVRIDPRTHIGAVRLTVSEVARSARFYEHALGLQRLAGDDQTASLGATDGAVLIELHGDRSAPQRDPQLPGLYHMAILMPDRAELARALVRLATAGGSLHGASDHLVSEALYLADPDGNGIEIYRDRPRDEWPHRDGTLSMATLPLDLDNLLSELGDSSRVERQVPPATTMGHVHLQVSDLGPAEEFYAGVLGFEVTVRAYPGALFVSAGGYHHHLGLNTWHSAGAPAPPLGAVGLSSFQVVLPTPEELERVVDRVRAAGLATEPDPGGLLVRDPSGNGVLLRAG